MDFFAPPPHRPTDPFFTVPGGSHFRPPRALRRAIRCPVVGPPMKRLRLAALPFRDETPQKERTAAVFTRNPHPDASGSLSTQPSSTARVRASSPRPSAWATTARLCSRRRPASRRRASERARPASPDALLPSRALAAALEPLQSAQQASMRTPSPPPPAAPIAFATECRPMPVLLTELVCAL